MFLSILVPISLIFAQIALGAILVKTKVLDVSASRVLAALVTNVTMPLMTFTSMVNNLNSENLKSAGLFVLTMAVLMFSLHVIGGFYTNVMHMSGKEKGIHRFTFVQSNTVFVGVAVMNALWGSETLMFVGLVQLVASIYSNTIGLYSIGSSDQKMKFTDFMRTPLFLGCMLGIVFGLLQIRLPAQLLSTMQSIGSMTTPLAMIYTGIMMTTMDLKTAFSSRNVIVTTVFRLLIIPSVTYLILHPIFRDNYYLYAVPTIMEAMPALTLLPIFAQRFNGDIESATALTAATTFCSLITIPVIIALFF